MHPIARVQATLPYIRDKFLNQVYPVHFMQNLPYGLYPPGYCIRCGRWMSQNERFPLYSITPRAMHQGCYDAWGDDIFQTEECFVSGEYFNKQKINAFHRNPNDLHNRLYDGKAEDYFSIVSGYALGYPIPVLDTPLWKVRQYRLNQGDYAPQNLQLPLCVPFDDVINIGFEEVMG